MPRTPTFRRLARIAAVGRTCAERGMPARLAMERLAEIAHRGRRRSWSRRRVLEALGIGLAGVATAPPWTPRRGLAANGKVDSEARIAVVGAGMAGLACADRLEKSGVVPVIYESSSRVGGRIKTWRARRPAS